MGREGKCVMIAPFINKIMNNGIWMENSGISFLCHQMGNSLGGGLFLIIFPLIIRLLSNGLW